MVVKYESGSGRKLIKLLVCLILMVVVLGGVVGFVLYYRLASNLPSIEILDNFRPSLASVVYDDNGERVHEFYIERRIWTPIDKIPKLMQQAIIAVEDARFYSHGGVDWFGILRAAWANLRKRRIEQGASTITQQLARRLFLTPEKTYKRKLREIILACQIEKKLASKQRILEYYLNEIYLGSGAYGVAAAAQVYFGKPLQELSLPQFALIAGLPRAPSRYSPLRNPPLAKRRRDFVLRRMAALGVISERQCQEAIATPLNTVEPGGSMKEAYGAWFFEHIRRRCLEIFKAPMDELGNGSEEESQTRLFGASAADVVYRDGLNIYSTIDMRLQAAAERAIDKGLREVDKRQGFRGPVEGGELDDKLDRQHIRPGLITLAKVTGITPEAITVTFGKDIQGRIDKGHFKWALNKQHELPIATGSVIEVKVRESFATDGPVPLSLEQEPQVEGALVAIDLHTGYVRAMVGGRSFKQSEFNRAIQSRRQPGSAFKPVIYAGAIDSGMIPTDIILDVPVYMDEADKVWKPDNYGERVFGPVTLQTALEKSKNLATINLIKRLSPELALHYARLFGIRSHLEPVPSLALGSMGVSLLELTSLYGVIATEGKRFTPIFIKEITDRSGHPLYEQEPEMEQVLSPQTAYVMIHMLKGVIQRGTGIRAKSLGHNLAGKTGTTNDFADAWFVGFSPDLVVGVWVGFDEIKPIGKGETGARAALPIWIEFMKEALRDEPEDDFPVPEGIVFRTVDSKTGELATDRTTDAIVEAFIKGTEPLEHAASTSQKARHFSEIDAGL